MTLCVGSRPVGPISHQKTFGLKTRVLSLKTKTNAENLKALKLGGLKEKDPFIPKPASLLYHLDAPPQIRIAIMRGMGWISNPLCNETRLLFSFIFAVHFFDYSVPGTHFSEDFVDTDHFGV